MVVGDLREHVTELVGIATTAPSLHNAQPWAFRVTTDVVQVFADQSRALRVMDPHGRQMFIGVGAAIYALRLAIRSLGAEPDVALLPDRDARADRPGLELVAEVAVGVERAVTPEIARLLPQIPRRRTIRERMDPRVPASTQQELPCHAAAEGAELRWIWRLEERKVLAHLVTMGEAREQASPRIQAELAQWVGGEEVRHGGGVGEETLGPSGDLTHAADFPARDFAGGRPRLSTNVEGQESQPTVALLTTTGDAPVDWLRAGQALMRVLLAATEHGLGASYYNQALELADLRNRLHEELAVPGFAQLVLRFGRPIDRWPVATQRRPVDDLLVR
jgi:hypothetical protein